MDQSIKAVFFGFAGGIVWICLFGLVTGLGGKWDAGAEAMKLRIVVSIAMAIMAVVIGCFAGGWITAKRAPHSPLTHALVLGVVMGLLSMGIAMPSEVRKIQFFVALVFTVFGGWVQTTQKRNQKEVRREL